MVILLSVLGVAVIMIVVEVLRPGRSWPRVAGWWVRALLLNGVQVGSVFLAGVAWDAGVHSYNYADLPLWDMMFGTFRNPKHWDARCGFGPEGEHRLGEMLRGVDIHASR